MKKFLTALFVVICAFAFIGCKKKSETTDPTSQAELPKITLETTSIEITVGDEYLLSPTVTGGAKLTISSADTTIVSVDGFTVKGLKEGQTTVTVSVVDHSDITATVTVVVKVADEPTPVVPTPTPTPVVPTPTPTQEPVKVSSIVVAGKASMEVGDTQTLTVTVSPSDASDASYELASSDTSVATVDANGLVTAVAKGSATITATAKDGSGVKGTLAITVKEAKPAEPTDIHIVIGDKEYAAGDTIQLTEFDEVKITWKYFPEGVAVQEGVDASVSNEKYAVLEDDTLKALAPGNVALMVYALYGDVEQTYIIAIAEKHFDPESIEITGTADISVREELQLTATVSPERADQSIKWTSSDETIATVSDNGLVKALAQGTVTIKATSGVLETVYKEVTLTVGAEAQFDRSIFYVDPSYTNKGEKLTVNGVEYVVGQNLQSNPLAAVKAADAGAKIYIAAGEYTEDITLDQSVYFIGVGDETILAGKILPQSGLDGFGFEKIHFTTSAGIVGPADANAVYKNFTMKDCNFDKATAGDDGSIRFYGSCENFVFENNKFYMTTYRGIRFENLIVGLKVINNEFTTTGTMYDYVRVMGQAGGEIYFEGNSFDFTNQSGVQIANPIEGAVFTFVDNYFKDMSNTSIDVREPAGDFTTGIKFVIIHNEFEGGANDWGVIRLRTVNLTEDQVEATVNYNKFIGINPADAGGEETPYFVDMAGASTMQQFGNFDKNFAILNDTVLKPDLEKAGTRNNWFEGQDKSAVDWFDSKEDLEAAYAKMLNPGDLFVDAALEAEDDTHFKTIANAIAKAEAGMVIAVAAGDYTDELVFDKDLAILGSEGAKLSGAITINDGVKLELDGIELNASISGTSTEGFALKNSVVAAGSKAILFSGNVKNAVFEKVTVLSNTSARFFRVSGTTENLTVKNSVFYSGAMYDWFRSDGAISGNVLFDGNVFNGSLQSALMMMYHGSGNFVITHNDFIDMAAVAIDIRTSNGVACTSTFDISYNLFDNTNTDVSKIWDPIRLRFNLYTAETLTAKCNYNAFLNWGTAESYYFLENASNQTDIKECVNCDYNFFDFITTPVADNFDGLASSWENAFATYDAWAVAVGRQAAKTVEITTTTNELFIGDELQLEFKASEGLELAFSSSDEAVATVDANGLVKALAAGTVTITLNAEGAEAPAILVLTVKEIPTTFDAVTVDPTLEADNMDQVKTLAKALEAINAGGTITVKAGTYEEELTIDKSVTILGPNAGKLGYAEDRAEEAILTKAITVSASDVKIDGITLKNQVLVATGATVDKLSLVNSVLSDFAGEGFVNGVSATLVSNVEVSGNYVAACAAVRFVRFGTLQNAKFNNNKIIGSSLYDTFRVDTCLFGDVEVVGNHVENTLQSVLMIMGVGEMNLLVQDNYFKDILATCVDTRNMVAAHAGDVTETVMHNTFDHAGYDWRCLRPRNANFGENTLDVQVHYNIFINGSCTEVEGVKTYANNPAGADVIYNMDYNLFEEVKAADLSNANFANVASSWANCFDDKEALEAAYLVKDFREVVYVDPTLEKEDDTHFKTMEAAMEVVFEGGKVVLAKGTHADKMSLTKSVTLTGEDGAVVTGLVYVLANNITIEGLEFTGASRVIYYTSTYADLTGFVFQNNYVHDTAAAAKAWQQTSYGAGITKEDNSAYPGFISLNGYYAWIKNPQILNNTFENLGDTAFYSNCTNDATVTGNVFNGVVNDGVRFDYSSCYGKFVITDNAFIDCSFFGVYLRSYAASAGAMDFTLESNYFKHCGYDANASVCTRSNPGAFGTAAHQESSAAAFKVNYNVFEDCADYINVRGNVTNSSSFALAFTLDVSYNAFITAEGALICGNLFGSDTTATNFAIGTFNNNFYGTDAKTKYAPVAAQFEHILAMDTTTFDTVALLEAGLPEGAHLGKLPAGPLTVAELMAVADEVIPSKDNVSTETYTVVGIVSSAPADKGTYYGNIYLKDALSDEKSFLVYDADKTDAVAELFINDTVTITGYLKNYNGTKEMTTVDNVKPQLVKVVRGLSTVSLSANSSDKATITGLPESGLNLSTFEITVVVEEGYVLASVKANGVAVEETDGKYVITVKGNTIVEVEAYEEGVIAAQSTLDIATYASAHWSTITSGKRVIEDEDAETDGYQASFTTDDGNFVLAMYGTDVNTGKIYGTVTDGVWADGANLRLYKSGAATLTVSVAEGKNVTLQSVALKFGSGAATVDGAAVTSGVGAAATNNSVVFTITTNIQITAIEFNYTYKEEDCTITYNLDGGSWAAKYGTPMAAGNAFCAQLNEFANLELDPADLDTDCFGASKFGNFLADSEHQAEWLWLLDAIWEAANGTDAQKASVADFSTDSVRAFYLANFNGFFTSTQHTDTWYKKQSADWTNAELTAAVMAKVPQNAGAATYEKGVGLATLATPSKEGYVFAGWVDASNNVVTSISAEQSGEVALTAKWIKEADLLLDYESLTAGTDYAGTDWTVYKYTDSWQKITATMMRVREKNGTKVLNMASGYSVPNKYIYNEEGQSLGLANYFSIDLGNYFSGAAVCPMKVALQDVNGNIIYVLGDANTWYEYPVTEALDKVEKTFDAAEIACFYIVLKSSLNSAYIYMDNVTLALK